MAMKNGQSLNKRDPGIAHNTAVVNVPYVTSQHLSAPSPYVRHRHTSLHPPPLFECDVIYGRPQFVIEITTPL